MMRLFYASPFAGDFLQFHLTEYQCSAAPFTTILYWQDLPLLDRNTFFLSTSYVCHSSLIQAMTEQNHLYRYNLLFLHLAVREMLMSGQTPALYSAKDKHNSNALPVLSYLVRWKTKPWK